MNGNTGENAYTIIETLHKSGRYCVYKARNYFSGRTVTIKTNEQRFRGDEARVRQLRDETETGLRLKHPNIRATIGLFEDGGTVYGVSEYIEGDTLGEILGIPHLSISYDQAVKLTLQLLDALDHAHRHQILHLNLNPSCVIITPEHDLKLFGFGKSPHAWKQASPEKHELHPVIFTSPEVFGGGNPDCRSDLWSAAVVAYLLFTGRLPWDLDKGLAPSEMKQSSLDQPPDKAAWTGKNLPDWLFNIIRKALLPDPASRFATADEMREAILDQQEVAPEAFSAPLAAQPATLEGPLQGDNQFSPPGVPQIPLRQGAKEDQLPAGSVPGPEIPSPATGETAPETEIAIKSEPPSPELRQLQKTFRTVVIISLLILLYIILKYYVINGRPIFHRAKTARKTEQVGEAKPREPNQPIEMVPIAGADAVLGSMDPDADSDEFPLQEVPLVAYLISPREITRQQWAMAMPDYTLATEEKDLPITNITFDDAVQFCNEKSRLDGLQPCYEILGNGMNCDFTANGYRLPTEAEWEYAAKGARRDDYSFYSGSTVADVVGWYYANSSRRLHPVGQKQPNQLKLHDLSGNAAEWVWNWYAPYTQSIETPFAGPDSGKDKVIRGGSYLDREHELRVTNRGHVRPFTKADNIGFRVVRTK